MRHVQFKSLVTMVFVALSAVTPVTAAGINSAELDAIIRDAKAKQASGKKTYGLQSVGDLDGLLNGAIRQVNKILACAQKTGQTHPILAQASGWISKAQEITNLPPVIKAFAAGPVKALLSGIQPQLDAVEKLACSGGSSGGGSSSGGGDKYSQVRAVFRQVGLGHLPDKAVRYAADTDMPARGGTPAALKRYLSQATVKKWYQNNSGRQW